MQIETELLWLTSLSFTLICIRECISLCVPAYQIYGSLLGFPQI